MVKAHVFPGSLAFQRAPTRADRPNDRRDIGMRVRPLSGPPTEKEQEKTYRKTTLFVFRYRLIIFALGVTWDVQGLSKSLDSQMTVFLSNSSNGIDVGRRHNCLWNTTL